MGSQQFLHKYQENNLLFLLSFNHMDLTGGYNLCI